MRWFRGSKDASADLESGVFGSHLAASILRRGSFKSRRGDGIGRSLQRVRRRVERRLGRIGLGKGKKVVGGVEEATGSCKKKQSFFENSLTWSLIVSDSFPIFENDFSICQAPHDQVELSIQIVVFLIRFFKSFGNVRFQSPIIV